MNDGRDIKLAVLVEKFVQRWAKEVENKSVITRFLAKPMCVCNSRSTLELLQDVVFLLHG
jgi:hypothetical protein